MSFVPSERAQSIYRAMLADYRSALSASMSSRDLETLGAIGHRIKGSAGLYGHPDLSNIGLRLMNAAENEQVEDALAATSEAIARISTILAQ